MRAGRSVSDRDAGYIRTLQGAARGFGLVAVEAGEAGAIEFLVSLAYRLREGIGLAQHLGGSTSGRIETLTRLALRFQCADLNDPTRMRRHWFERAILLNGPRLNLCS